MYSASRDANLRGNGLEGLDTGTIQAVIAGYDRIIPVVLQQVR
jgi:hypothetical protein